MALALMTSRSARRKKQRTREAPAAPAAAAAPSYALFCLILVVGVFALYAGAYRYPLVFDDRLINPVHLTELASACATLHNRCLSYSTFGLTYLAVGLDLFWFRAANVLLHALTALALYGFLDRLFDAVARSAPDAAGMGAPGKNRLLAFTGAVLFAVHPVTVYGVAYLTQRSIVMATLFSLLSLTAFVRALMSGDRRWLWLATLLYIAALFSKEHAIMLPAIAIAIAVLLGKRPGVSRREQIAITAVVLAAGAFITYKLSLVIGSAYEYYTRELGSIKDAGGATRDPAGAWLGSVVTQMLLYFKYAFLWLVPYPGWMSIDLRTSIGHGLLAWPQVLGLPAFLAWGAAAGWLVLKRGPAGLAGVGLLFPWLLFFTEFVTTRIQEPFVLYRGYLWMAGVPLLLPLIARRASATGIIAACAVLTLLFGMGARDRIATFENNLKLWDDVVRKNTDLSHFFVDRGYSNRAVALLREGRLDESLRDLEMTIKLNPRSSHAYVNRGTVLRQKGNDQAALADYRRAIELDPAFADGHGELCAQLLKMEQRAQALESCNTALKLEPMLPTARLNRAVIYSHARRFDDALSDLNRIIKVEPNHGITLFNRGMVLREMGRAVDSEQDLRASCLAGFAPACKQLKPASLPRKP